MVFDLTAQLAPMMWMLIGLMAVSAVSLLAAHGQH